MVIFQKKKKKGNLNIKQGTKLYICFEIQNKPEHENYV